MEQGLTRLETLFDALEEFACNHLGLKESEVDQIITNLGETPEGRAELGQ